MTLFFNLLNNHFLIHDWVFLGLFIGYANLLIYSFFTSYLNYGVIIIYFNLIFMLLSKQFKFLKQYNKYFRVFRFLTFLFMLLKFIWIYHLIYYSLCISIVILLGYAFFRDRRAFAASATKMSMLVLINPETNKITVYPDRSTRVISNFDTVERKFEFTLSNEKIHEISNSFGINVNNNVITGKNANRIVETYLMPLIESSDMHSLFLEILNPF